MDGISALGSGFWKSATNSKAKTTSELEERKANRVLSHWNLPQSNRLLPRSQHFTFPL